MKIQATNTAQHYQNYAKETEKKQEKSQKELSSGKKVNTAADDAVALELSEEILKEANSLNAGSNNISYGIDAANIADGALSSISDSLGDIEQNTVRAMNGLYSDSDRAIMQQANEASYATINQTISQATYNGKNLLDGSSGDISIYTGTSSMAITETDAKAAVSSLENFDVSVSADSISTDALDGAYSSVSSMRSSIGATTNGLSAAYNVNNTTVQNLEEAASLQTDSETYDAVTRYKASGIVGAAQNYAMKNQMESEENLVTKMFEG